MRKKAIVTVAALFLCQLSYAASKVENVNQSNLPRDVLLHAYPDLTDETSNTAATSEEIQNTVNDGSDEATVLTPTVIGDEEEDLENANTNKNVKRKETKTKRTNKTKKSQTKTKPRKEKAKKMTLDEKLDSELSNLSRMLDNLEGK